MIIISCARSKYGILKTFISDSKYNHLYVSSKIIAHKLNASFPKI